METKRVLLIAGGALAAMLLQTASARLHAQAQTRTARGGSFDITETSIDQVQAAYKAGKLTARQLVQRYLDRIDAYDKQGPKLNAIITLNPKALEEADKLDQQYKQSGPAGPLHGIPILVKDEIDTAGMATTLGSVLFKDYRPPLDAFVVARLRKGGAIILGKTTLAEFAAGDTYGSLFGVTRNPYDLDRTVGGSSGGSGAATSANFSTVAVGEETSASLRRPGSWNGIVAMRPTAGLVSRTGMYDGYPSEAASMGPMARTVRDLAELLDVMVGYDTEDPLTALGAGHSPQSYAKLLDRNALRGARIGILRESIGTASEPASDDFKKVDAVFEKNVTELKAAGAILTDPLVIPDLKELLARRYTDAPTSDEALRVWLGRNPGSPFRTREDVQKSPDFSKIFPGKAGPWASGPRDPDPVKYREYLMARQKLTIYLMKAVADHHLDAIVHKSVEHQPTFIRDGVNPPYVTNKGVPTLNTFLVYVPSITVPSGFTTDDLPTGITFLGGPYSDATMINLAYSYEQNTQHRKPPKSTPPLR